MDTYDIAVIGVGGLGAAACYWAKRRGLSVIGLEQFQLGHERGGSQDHSRIIRRAQNRHDEAQLIDAAYSAWREVEADAEQQLLTITGGLIIEAPDEPGPDAAAQSVHAYAQVMAAHDFPFERLDATEIASRWPAFQLSGSEQGLYAADSGIVDANHANAAHIALARARGADIREQQTVRRLSPDGDGVRVETDTAIVKAQRAIVTCGAWTNRVLADVARPLPLRITQEQVTYYTTPHPAEFTPPRFPVFMWRGAHNYYGFPVHGPGATKLGEHIGGPDTTADSRTFAPDPARQQRYQTFLQHRLPRFLGPEKATRTCLYTLTPDDLFVLDRVPERPQIAVAVGAGHAFKYASLFGQLLTELAVQPRTSQPIESFRLDRLALTA
jgi:sarcosine oxidase